MSSVSKKKLGRPSKGRTPKEKKEFLKERSRIYYSDPERKKEQLERMKIYREKNREKINAKKRAKTVKRRFEKDIKRIWVARGLIVGNV